MAALAQTPFGGGNLQVPLRPAALQTQTGAPNIVGTIPAATQTALPNYGAPGIPLHGGSISSARPANLAPGTGAGRDNMLIHDGNLAGISDRIAAIFENRGVSLNAAPGEHTGPHGSYGGEAAQDRLQRLSDQVLSGNRTFDEIRASVDWQARQAPKALPGLPAQQVSELDARRRAASRSFAEAIANQAAQTTRLDLSRDQGLSRIGREFEDARYQGREAYADTGQVRNPRQKGRLFRTLRDGEARGRGELLANDAVQRDALNAWVEQARIARDDEIAALAEQEMLLRSDPAGLYSPIQF